MKKLACNRKEVWKVKKSITQTNINEGGNEVLKESFKEVKVIAQNNKYKVYFASNKTN